MEGFGAVVLGFIFVCVGIAGIKHTQKKVAAVADSFNWPFTKGSITQSEVVFEDEKLGNTPFGTGYFHRSKIEYTYTVREQTYCGDTITIGGELEFGLFQGGEKRAKKRCDRYPVGATKRVYYDPYNPSTSCLERKSEMGTVGYLIWTPFLLFGLVAIVTTIF